MIKKRILNLFLSLTITATMITPVSSAKAETNTQTVNINENLIGYWNFDNGTLSNLVDNNNNGELIGNNISITDSDMGKALHFGNDSNSYMKVGKFINSGTTSYSISMWYKYDTNIATTQNTVLAQQDGNGRSLLLLTPDNKYRTFVNAMDVDSNANIDRNLWQHVTITIDPSSKKIKYYVNGKFDSEKDAGSSLVNELTSLLIGRHKSSGTSPQSMKGDIDEIRVYNKVINDEEAKAIYKSKLPYKTLDTDLIGYWNFDKGQVLNLAGGENGKLVGSHVSIGESSHKNMDKSLVFTKGNDSNLRIDNFVNTSVNPYSFSLWYKTDNISVDRHTILLQQDEPGRSLLTLRLDNKYGSYVYGQDVLTSSTISKGNWQNIIMTLDPSTNKIKYYVNGKLDGEYDSGSNKVNQLTNLLIGSHKVFNTANPQQFVGEIDEIRVYDYVIDDKIAKEIYDDKADKSITLTIDSNNIQRDIDDATFGINHRYAFNGYGSFDPVLDKVREDFQTLYKNANFGSIRYPGGTISNLFRWKDSIGNKSNRKNQIHGFYNAAQGIEPNFGLDEIGTFANDTNSEIVYVYGLGRGSASDAADLVEYLNAELGTNPNGGVEWAKVRENNGHPKPYNVRYFEIGNEMNLGGGSNADGSTSQMYWTAYDGDGLQHYINGGTINITKQSVVNPENWNSATNKSDGTANQVKYMRYANIIPGRGSVTDEMYQSNTFTAVEKGSVYVYVDDVEWNIVDDIKKFGAENVVEVNYFTGEILFGDGTNGNIPKANSNIKVSYTVKKDGFVQVSQAMRDTLKQINEESKTNKEIHIYAGYESEGFINSMNSQGYNDFYDGLTIHPYSGTPSGNGEAFYDSAMSLADTNAANRVKRYVNMMPEGKVPVISEFGIFSSTNPLVRSQTHALYIAKSLMEYVSLGSPYIQKHCLVDWYSSGADSLGPTQQAVIQAVPQEGANTTKGEGDYKFFSTPSAHVFEMINGMFGNEVIGSSFNNMLTFGNNVNMFNALASKDNNGNIYIAIVNLDKANKQAISIDVKDVDLTGKTVNVQKLSGNSFSAENTLDNPNNVSIEKSSFTANGEALKVELDAHSFTIFKINNKDIDKSNLEELYNANKDKVEEKYTVESWRVFKTALENAKAVLDNDEASQEEVDVAIANLNSAIEELEEKPVITEVNKDELIKVVEEAKAIKLEDYTLESVDLLVALLENAEILLNDKNASQESIDKLKEDILKAISNLIPKEDTENTDKKVLGMVIEYAEEAKTNGALENVVPAVVNEFEVALKEAKTVLGDKNATESQVDVATKRLINVIHMLEFKKGDKAELIKLVDIINALNENKYTPSSWNKLKTELDKANKVIADENVMEAEVSKAYENLNKAFAGLELVADKSKLQSLVTELEAKDMSKYTVGTVTKFKTALDNAKAILDNKESTQEQINDAYNKLIRAYLELRLIPDKSKLEDLINKVESMDLSKYTKASVNKLNLQLAKVKTVLNNEEASQKEVDEAAKGLELALNNLEVKQNNNGNNNNNGNSNNNNNSGNNNNGNTNKDNNKNNTKDDNKLPQTGGINTGYISILGVGLLVIGLLSLKRKRISN